ncbi:hypothetical protein B0J12DRAFT_769062 [Macrophomina phaseolina]|uniref:BZIP domain-containing protein n=1 Tax=Macrophomina phaseolina TaxID=35725 RepID=A0ABQ8FVB3_9PEZI|nr:hypothetical protein B0J12DRAFT_769062 [Macrophomina phaseolina]
MAHRTAARVAPDGVPSRDDWKSMNDMIEKKRAQNRIAQRNYRKNVKRRIEELQQQVATQAKLLALEGEASKLWNAGVSSLGTGEVALSVDQYPSTSAQERQKDASAPLPTPASHLFSPPEVSAGSDTLFSALSDCHEQGDSNQHKERFYSSLDSQVAGRTPAAARDGTGRQPRVETHEQLDLPESSTSFTDMHMGMLDGMHLRSATDPFHFSGHRSQNRDNASNWCDFDRGSHSPSTTSDDLLLADGDATFEPTIEGRIEYLIRCARKAGFQDLDSAIIAFYTTKFDEESGCSIAQHLSRKRCLPKLLEELRSHTASWKSREAQPYQDEVLKSAENLLLAEMRSTPALRVDGVLSASSSGDGDGRWGAVSHQLQDEVSIAVIAGPEVN